MSGGELRFPRRDELDVLGRLVRRVGALETGTHPTRGLRPEDEAVTEWITLEDLAAGWTSTDAAWRLYGSLAQLDGTLEGPAGWADGAVAAAVPIDLAPSRALTLQAVAGDGTPIRVEITTAGELLVHRDGQVGDDVNLGAITFLRA